MKPAGLRHGPKLMNLFRSSSGNGIGTWVEKPPHIPTKLQTSSGLRQNNGDPFDALHDAGLFLLVVATVTVV